MPRLIDKDARRRMIAAAVWQVAREEGIGAVSIRTVADAAGISAGSLRHVFPSRAELLEFSGRLMIDRAHQRIAAIDRDQKPEDFVRAVLDEVLPLSPEAREELEVNFALVAEAPRHPQLRAIRDEAHRELAEGCAALVETLTGGRDPLAVRRLHALVDGVAFHLLNIEPGVDGYATPESARWAHEVIESELQALTSTSAG